MDYPPYRSSPAREPAFRPLGTVTVGNASPLNVGAAALLLVDQAAATWLGSYLVGFSQGR